MPMDLWNNLPLPVQPCDCGKVIAPGEHHCWHHHVDEYPTTGEHPYIVCGECFHVFMYAGNLVDEYMEHRQEGDPRSTPDAHEIFFCPLCIHDF